MNWIESHILSLQNFHRSLLKKLLRSCLLFYPQKPIYRSWILINTDCRAKKKRSAVYAQSFIDVLSINLLFCCLIFFFQKKMHVSTFPPNSGFIEHFNKSDHRYNKQRWPIINFVFSGQVVNWPCVRFSSFWGIAKALFKYNNFQ